MILTSQDYPESYLNILLKYKIKEHFNAQEESQSTFPKTTKLSHHAFSISSFTFQIFSNVFFYFILLFK